MRHDAHERERAETAHGEHDDSGGDDLEERRERDPGREQERAGDGAARDDAEHVRPSPAARPRLPTRTSVA